MIHIRRRLTACMSLYFPNPSQSLEAQPSLIVPSEVSLHTFISAKVGVPASSQQCWDSAPHQEELLHMYRGLGCSYSQQYLFFPVGWVEHCHSVRPMVLVCMGRHCCMGCTENTLLSRFCFELVWVFSSMNTVFRCSHEAVVLSVCLPSSVD